MKKFLLLCLATLICSLTWARTFVVDDIRYTVISDDELTCEVGPWNENDEPLWPPLNMVIPEKVCDESGNYYTVIGIGDAAFYGVGSSHLSSVEFPNSITYIGSQAFQDASGLQEIEIPASVKTIGYQAFRNVNPEKLTLNEGLENIESEAFWGSQITGWEADELTIPSTVTNIGSYAFSQQKIKKITILADLEEIAAGTFRGNTILEDINIPENVTSIGFSAFELCSSLKEITLPEGLESIDLAAFRYCTALESITIPDNVSLIAEQTFLQCSALEKVILGTSVTSIGEYAFQDCTNLTSVTMGDLVESVLIGAFQSCTSLKEITLPETVDLVEYSAFLNCSSLADVYSLNPEPPEVMEGDTGQGAFDGIAEDAVLHVPCDSKDAYASAYGWSTFTTIEGIDCSDDGGDHEGDYLTAGTMGFDLSLNNTDQEITYTGPSGTVYEVKARYLNSGDYEGNLNFYATTGYLKNTSSVGNLRKVIFEDNGHDGTSSAILYVRASNEGPWDGSNFTSYGTEVAQVPVSTGGEFTIEGDYAYFACYGGNSMTSYRFKSVEVVWETENTSGQTFEYTVDPEQGTVTESFNVITLTCPSMILGIDGEGVVYGGPVNVYKDGSDEPYTTSTSVEGDTNYWMDDADTYLIITLEKAISEAGEYEVVIPAGTFYWFNNDDPVLNDEIILNYTFEGNSGTGSGDHEGDYLTAGTMGFDLSLNNTDQEITYTGPSGTVYEVKARYLNSGDYEGNLNFYATTGYLKNTSSVGNLRKVIFEDNGHDGTSSAILYVRASNEGPWDGSNFTSYGTEVAQVPVSTGGEFTIEGDYAYFACYGGNSMTSYRFKSIEVVWETEGGSNPEGSVPDGYIIDPAEGEVPSLSVITIDTEDGMGESSDFYNETKKAEFTVVNDDTNETVATLGSWEIMMDDNTYHTWVEIRLSNEVSEAGSYTVNIPEGVFLDIADYEYIPNPAFSIHYTMTGNTGSDYTIVVSPESGETLESLSEFSITCADGMTVANWDDPLEVKKGEEVVAHAWGDISIQEGSVYIGYTFPLCGTDDQGSVTLTEAGTYTIHVPGEYFLLGDNDNVDEYNEEFDIVYIIGGGEPTGTYSYVVDPVEGQVESLSVIEFSSDDEDVDGFLGNYEYALYSQEALVYDRSVRGEPITTATLESGGELDDYDSSIIITLKDEITDPGSYVVVIPEGSFYWIVDDEPILNEEIELSYYIEAPQGEYTFDPADKSELTSLSEFTVYYEDGGIACSWSYVGYITVYDENNNYVAYDVTCVENESEDDPYGDYVSCTITLNTEIVADGTYTITIPEGYFIVSEGENYLDSKELVITYTIKTNAGTETGIGGISINDENVEGIYSTSGQKLNKAQKGVNIIRYTDGSAKKLYVK